MSLLAPAALLTAGLLVAASASADQGDMALPPPTPPTPAVAAPAAAPPPPAPVAPAYPAPLPYAPGYAVPYVVYPAYGAGAPPPYWAPRVAATERRSNGMRTTGIVLFAAGGAITAVGVVIFGAVATTPCVNFADGSNIEPAPAPAAAREHIGSARQPLNGCDTSPTLGLGIMGAGLLTAVVGIPLFVIGSKQVPARTTTGKLAPELSVGAANASLRWVF
jgi:hypothetical protein